MRLRDNPVDNQLQKDMWNGRAGASWVRHNSLLEELQSRAIVALFEPAVRKCLMWLWLRQSDARLAASSTHPAITG